LFSHVPLPLSGPSHPPYLPISLFWTIYGRFFLYIHILFYLHVYIHDL
jgi:hypothetical protein